MEKAIKLLVEAVRQGAFIIDMMLHWKAPQNSSLDKERL